MINFLKKSILFSAAIMFAACSASVRNQTISSDNTEVIAAEGRVFYNDRNINETREKAIYDAKLKAVRRVAELFADALYKAEGKYETFEKLVTEDPDFFIHKYKIKHEGQDRDSYVSQVNLYIYTEKIASAVRSAGLASSVKGPKAAIYIEETPEGTSFQKAFIAALSKDSIMTVELLDKSKIGDGSYDALTAASAEIGAEMFIKAKAKAYLFGGGIGTDFHPSGADGSVEVIQVPSGKRLSDISRQGSGSDSSKDVAMSKAMESLAALLSKDTAARVDPQLKSDPAIKLIFSGLSGIEQAETLKSDLLKMNFKYISLDSYANGRAVFSSITKTQDCQEIASMILRGESLGAQLGEVSGKEINFILY